MANNHEQSNTTTNNSNELIGGGGRGSISPVSTFASRRRTMFPVREDGLQNSLIEPGQTFGTININELRTNTRTMEGSDAMASALVTGTVSGEGGRARGRAPGRARARGSFMTGLLMDMERRNPSMASSGRGDGGADVGNSMGPGVGHGGTIPNMNSNGGNSRMASGLAPVLGQMGLPRPGPTGLAPAANFPTQTAASDGVVSGRGNGLSLSLNLSSVTNYGVDGSKRDEGGRADGPGEEVQGRRSQKRMMEIKEEAPSPRAPKHVYTDKRCVIPNMKSNFEYSGMGSALPPGLRQQCLHQAGPTGLAPSPNFPTQSPASDKLGTIASHGILLALPAVGTDGIDGCKRQEVLGSTTLDRKFKKRESSEKSRLKQKAKVGQLEEDRNRLSEENNRLEEEKTRLSKEMSRLSREQESMQLIIKRLGSEGIARPLQPDGTEKKAA